MISILIATRNRKDKLKRLLDSIDIECEVLVAADNKSDIPEKSKIDKVIFTNEPVVPKINKLAEIASYAMLGIADDCEFIPGALSIASDKQIDTGVIGMRTRNMPDAGPTVLVGRSYYNRLGYLLHQDFLHFFSDTDFIDTAVNNGVFIMTDIQICDHWHPAVTREFDETHNYKRAERWSHDNEVYRRRVLHRQLQG